MPNIASILKAEIARVARKEVRRETAVLKKASTTHRSEVAALRRRAAELERRLREVRKGVGPSAEAANDASIPEGTRFSAKSLTSHRKRLGLSAADLGLLMGTSTQSIYNWESGKARPQAKYLPVLVALRSVGKRQTLARLEAVKSAA
jgi:DNA-binding transcriptional regulator YiaG